MNKYQKIPDLNIYDQGYQEGMTLALNSEKLHLKKHIPYKSMLKLQKWKSYKLGIEAGFEQGIRIREQNKAYKRLKELDQIEKEKEKSKGRDDLGR